MVWSYTGRWFRYPKKVHDLLLSDHNLVLCEHNLSVSKHNLVLCVNNLSISKDGLLRRTDNLSMSGDNLVGSGDNLMEGLEWCRDFVLFDNHFADGLPLLIFYYFIDIEAGGEFVAIQKNLGAINRGYRFDHLPIDIIYPQSGMIQKFIKPDDCIIGERIRENGGGGLLIDGGDGI